MALFFFIYGKSQMFRLLFTSERIRSIHLKKYIRNLLIANIKLTSSEHEDHLTVYQSITSAKFRSCHYILDRKLASSVADIILKNRSSQNSTVLEINPGPGIVTKELFHNGVQHIVATDTKDHFLSLIKKHFHKEISEGRLHCFQWDCFGLWHRDSNSSNFDKDYKEKEMEIVASLQQTTPKNHDDICVTAFGILSRVKERPFLNYLLLNSGMLEGLFSVGRIEWFLFVSAKIYKTVLSGNDHYKNIMSYNSMSVLLYLLFDIEHHTKVPGHAFSPPFQLIKRKKKEVVVGGKLVKYNMKYLLHMKPKKNLESILPALEIFKFSLFLKQLFHKKRMRLIPKMEELIPGCGIHLIRAGYTMVQEVGEISPEEFLWIYKDMQSWSEYYDSGLYFYLMEHTVHGGMDEETGGGD